MAIVISGVNNNDKITASDGTIDLLSGVNYAGIITAPAFTTPGSLTAGHLNIGSGIQLGNAGIITATTLIGNVTGNVNHTSNLLLQISGSEKFRVGTSGQFGIAGANYGTSGQVLTSGGSGSAPTWSTIASDKITEGNTEAEVVDTGSDGHFKVTTEGSERLRIDSDGRILVGHDSARVISTTVNPYLQLEGTDYHQSSISVTRNTDDAYGSYLILGKSRATSNGGNAILQDNDIISEVRFAGSDGNDMVNIAAQIRVEVDGTPQTDQMPGAMIFYTNSGGASATERLRLTAAGNATFSGICTATGFSGTFSPRNMLINGEMVANQRVNGCLLYTSPSPRD